MTAEDLIAFEKEVAEHYEKGLIKSPIHLSGGNESQLLEIFQDIKRTDCVLATWRSHYAALLHGIPPDELMRQILAGKSMSINLVAPWFYSSSIAGGILPIAVGLGMAIKRSAPGSCGVENCCHCSCRELPCRNWLSANSDGGHRHYEIYPCPMWGRKVWCFVGDMAAKTGIFSECMRYAFNFQLPVVFVVEDNGKSVATNTNQAWGIKNDSHRLPFFTNVIYYQYELTWPHHGTGKYVAF